MTNTRNFVAKLQITAIVLMIAGWSWSGGNFTPSDAPLGNYLAHCIPIALLLVMSLQLFHLHGTITEQAERSAKRARIGVSILAVIAIIGASVMITLGIVNPDPNSVGVHNFADWFPTVILNMGTFLWLATMLPFQRSHAVAHVASN